MHNEEAARQQEERRITVRVLFFGAAREAASRNEATLEVRAPASTRTVFEEIINAYPQLARFGRSLLIAVNEEYVPTTDQEIHEGDTLAVFPPVSGGSESSYEAIKPCFFLSVNVSTPFFGTGAGRIFL